MMNRKLKRYVDSVVRRSIDAFYRDSFVENVLAKIRKALHVTPNSLYLRREIEGEHDFGSEGKMYQRLYRIMSRNAVKDIPVGWVEVWNFSNGVNYVAELEISPVFRNAGLGTELLKSQFSGHYIVAGNPRVKSLYTRLGRPIDRFTNKESREINKAFAGYGMWRLN